MKNHGKAFSDLVRKKMAEKGMSEDELAKKATLSKNTVYDVLRNERNANTATISKISNALGISKKELEGCLDD